MPDEYESAGCIRIYLTGAASDGGAQANPDAALGNYRSSTEITQLGVTVTDCPANITVDQAGGANGTGDGTLTVKSVNSLAWTPPGGTEGATVTIANGETKTLEGGGDGNNGQLLIVSRTSADDITGGPATVTLAYTYNNVIALDNVSSAERTAGDVEYRAACIKNHGTHTVQAMLAWLEPLAAACAVNVAGYAASGAITITRKAGRFDDDSYPDSGYVENDDTGEVMYYASRTDTALSVAASGRDIWTDVAGGAAGSEDDVLTPIPGYRIATEAPSAQADGYYQTIANENTAPTSVTWKHGHSDEDADVLDIGSLASGYIAALWLQRAIIAGATAEASVLVDIGMAFDALGTV